MAAFFGSSLHGNLNLKRNMELGLVIFKLKGKTINSSKSGQVLLLISGKILCLLSVLPLLSVGLAFAEHCLLCCESSICSESAILFSEQIMGFYRSTCNKILHLHPSPKFSLKCCLHPPVWVTYLMAMNIFRKVTFLLVICSRTLEL